MLRCPVEDSDVADVQSRHLRSYQLVATRLMLINKLCELILLEYSQVHIGLGHSVQGIFQDPVPTVPDAVRSETDRTVRTYHSLCFALTSPRRNVRTPTHTQLT